MEIKTKRYTRRKLRVRSKVTGTAKIPRLSAFRSNVHIYGQLIDDVKALTLASSSDLKIKKAEKQNKVQIAGMVGEALAKAALTKKIKKVVFDRNGFAYHGRIKALADGARKGGLDF